jgi:protein-S-isoprenylcysteine O-methyltransferase Ste14
VAWHCLDEQVLPSPFHGNNQSCIERFAVIGMLLIVSGLTMFFAGAIPVYWSKFRSGRAVTGGLYSFIRHPQYVGLAITGAGAAPVWPRFLVLVTLVLMIRHGTGLLVLTLTGDRICAMTRFENSVLPWFGLPRSLPG